MNIEKPLKDTFVPIQPYSPRKLRGLFCCINARLKYEKLALCNLDEVLNRMLMFLCTPSICTGQGSYFSFLMNFQKKQPINPAAFSVVLVHDSGMKN